MLIIIKERDGPYDYYHIATAIGGYGSSKAWTVSFAQNTMTNPCAVCQ